MIYDYITQVVKKVKTDYDECEPYRLCKVMDIILLEQPLGQRATSIKGFFLEVDNVMTITVNFDLPEMFRRVIVAHEIGHALLHRGRGITAFHEVQMFDESSAMEQEANLFAAELLLDDETVIDVLNDDTTFTTAASILGVPAELLDFKFRLLKWKGYKLTEPPVTAYNDFLLNVEVPYNADYD